MNHQLSKEQISKFEETFSLIDRDCNGTINKEELDNVMRSLGHRVTEVELQDFINKVDGSSNAVDLPGFLTIMGLLKTKNNKVEEEFREVFNVFDIDGNGFISATELRQVMGDLGDKPCDAEVEELMRHADTDGNGRVSFEEFVSMMTSK